MKEVPPAGAVVDQPCLNSLNLPSAFTLEDRINVNRVELQ